MRMSCGVYFIGIRGHPHLFKIGKSTNCERRLKQLQTGNPNELYIARIILHSKPFELESSLHKYFATRRRRGEWFYIGKKRVDRIRIAETGVIWEELGYYSLIKRSIYDWLPFGGGSFDTVTHP